MFCQYILYTSTELGALYVIHQLTWVKMQYDSIILTIFHMWKMSLNMVKLFGQGYATQKKIHFSLIAWLILCSALLNYLLE